MPSPEMSSQRELFFENSKTKDKGLKIYTLEQLISKKVKILPPPPPPLKVRREETQVPDLVILHLNDNHFEETQIMEMSRHLSILFPKLRSIDLSVMKKAHPKHVQQMNIKASQQQ